MGFIYIIKNKINNKVYIGQTIYDINYRFEQHIKQSKYIVTNLYSAFKKYGIENFYVEKLEEVETAKLNEREIYWINKYNSYNEGYNMTIGGQGYRKFNIEDLYEDWKNGESEAQIKNKYNISDTTIWKVLNLLNISQEERNLRKSKSLVKNSDEQVLQLWNKNYSIRQIEQEIGGCRETIKKQLLRNNITEEEIQKRGLIKRGKPVLQFDLNNNFIKEYNTAKEAAIELNLSNYSNISNCCSGRRKTAYGYIWKYKK